MFSRNIQVENIFIFTIDNFCRLNVSFNFVFKKGKHSLWFSLRKTASKPVHHVLKRKDVIMARFSGILLMMCLLCAITRAGAEPGTGLSKYALGYDEGLSAKYIIAQKWSANVSVGYDVVGADSVYKQPLNTVLLKIGGQYIIAEFNRLRVGGFLDFVETMKEGQLTHTAVVGPDKIYYQWSSSGRIGLAPELFLSDHLSITYKFGAIINFFGTTYKLNADESGIETKDNGYVTGGVFGFQSNSPFMLIHNIALYVYF
jgi:hypothetical protein